MRRARRIAPAQRLALGAALAISAGGMGFAAIGTSALEAAEALPVAMTAPAPFEAQLDRDLIEAPATGVQTGLIEETVEEESNILEDVGTGVASYYGKAFAGRRTASGDVFDPAKLTAAHRTLPFGSRVQVTNQRNGRAVIVRINDRGPFHGNRVIDLSRAAASEIGIVGPGSGRVELALVAS